MKCNEAGELMQRRLDYDLSEQEAEQVDAHLASCKACHSMNSKLAILSAQLEQLPEVSPPFSIVDSIMPTLAEIDKKRASVITLEEAVATQLKQKKRSWLYGAASSIVAAAALLFVFNISDNQKSYDSANMATTAQLEMDSTVMSDENAMSRKTGYTMSNMERMAVSEESLFEATEQVDKMRISVTSAKSENAEQDTVATGGEEATSTHGQTVDAFDVNDQLGDEFTSHGYTPELSFKSPDFSDPSPDSRFYLVQEEHMIMVHDFESGELLKEIVVPIKGDISFIGWHETGVEFYIEVLDEHQQTHTITLPTGL